MPLYPFQGKWPRVAPDAFVAPTAVLIGDVEVGPRASVWYNAVLRADTAPIVIGPRSNVQDNATLHVDPGAPCILGEDVTVGHGAIVHGATVGDRVLIAMHATVLTGARIGNDVMIGANALVGEGKAIDDHSLVIGVPGKVVRPLTPAEVVRVRMNAMTYVDLAKQHHASLDEPDKA